MPEQPITVAVEIGRFEELIKAEKTLSALEAGGVDNWEWYYESLKDGGLIEEDDD